MSPPQEAFGDVTLAVGDDNVAEVEIHRPPHNYFDLALIDDIAASIEAAAERAPAARAVVLCSEGRSFCAGANLTGPADVLAPIEASEGGPPRHLYDAAVRLFSTTLPVVAAVQGAAIGGGLGLALFADFRVASPQSRLAANFARLGFHHGFGMTVTLPAAVGPQLALDLLYTGRRVEGEEALGMGLVDRLAPSDDDVRSVARDLATEIAGSAPLAVASIRETMRGPLADAVRAATDRERAEQDRLRTTPDFREGVRAASERRDPIFIGLLRKEQ